MDFDDRISTSDIFGSNTIFLITISWNTYNSGNSSTVGSDLVWKVVYKAIKLCIACRGTSSVQIEYERLTQISIILISNKNMVLF